MGILIAVSSNVIAASNSPR